MKSLVVTATAALLLTACGSLDDGSAQPSDDAVTVDQFVACLKSEGVDARVSAEWGLVAVYTGPMNSNPDCQGGGDDLDGTDEIWSGCAFPLDGDEEVPLRIETDGKGRDWTAALSSAYFADDPEIFAAYTACEARFPSFRQPEFDPSYTAGHQERLERDIPIALEFAECARAEGFAWVEDPDPDQGWLMLPDSVTASEFRAVLEACWDPSANGPAWGQSGPDYLDIHPILDEVQAEKGF